jgi:uncharacterized protein (TIGR00255 family)
MTAYGRAVKETPFGRWVVEIHSVNRKMLDVNMVMSKELLRFDLDVRKWIAEEIVRGQVTAKISHVLGGDEASFFLEPLKELQSSWEKVAEKLGYDPKKTIDLRFLMERAPQQMSLELQEHDEKLRKILKEAVGAALDELSEMKVREGKNLKKDLEERVETLERDLKQIHKKLPKYTEEFGKKLLERVQGLVELSGENEEKLVKEIATVAEKADITEEVTRLTSHFEQFRHYLNAKEKGVGRTLDFLVQEMHREINTMAAKAQEVELSHLTVKMRSECEKIREQLQNVE